MKSCTMYNVYTTNKKNKAKLFSQKRKEPSNVTLSDRSLVGMIKNSEVEEIC